MAWLARSYERHEVNLDLIDQSAQRIRWPLGLFLDQGLIPIQPPPHSPLVGVDDTFFLGVMLLAGHAAGHFEPGCLAFGHNDDTPPVMAAADRLLAFAPFRHEFADHGDAAVQFFVGVTVDEVPNPGA
jgi:hypothetical protein